MNVDRFGVPDNIWGHHDEDFLGAIGRITLLSAQIEYQALTIYQAMTNSRQEQHRLLSANQLIEKALCALRDIADEESRAILFNYFTQVKEHLQRRNDYIHSLWPAQSGSRVYGWRPSRAKEDEFDPLRPNENIETTFDEIAMFIRSLVDLIQQRDRVYDAARVEQDRILRRGGTI